MPPASPAGRTFSLKGTYNVVAWNEGTASDPKPVTVPDGGTSEADFTLR